MIFSVKGVTKTQKVSNHGNYCITFRIDNERYVNVIEAHWAPLENKSIAYFSLIDLWWPRFWGLIVFRFINIRQSLGSGGKWNVIQLEPQPGRILQVSNQVI